MGILELIFPRKCLDCGKDGRYVCDSCLKKVRICPKICPECEKLSPDGMTHEKCKRKLGLDGAVSVWLYQGVIRKAILKLKYRFVLEIAKEISDYLCGFLKDNGVILPPQQSLVPIPLHRLRGNWRGFNQSEEIGRLVAQKMGWEFAPGLLIRKRTSKAQTELKGRQRLENIRGVFSLSPDISISQYPSILLFDDVLTTGSTLKEAAKVLKRSGAKQVWGLTIAR